MAEPYRTTLIEHLLRRESPDQGDFVTTSVADLDIDDAGIVGPAGSHDKHRGHFVRAGVRNDGFSRKGHRSERAEIFNHRQISIIDLASLAHIASGLELGPKIIRHQYGISPEEFVARHIGVNIVVGELDDGRSLNDLTPPYHLGTFDDAGNFDVSMLVVSYNEPCVIPGRAIGEAYAWGEGESMGRQFVEVARAHRGYVGITSMAGTLTVGREAMIVPLPQVPRDEATA